MNRLCGISATSRTLIAVVASGDGTCCRPITAARTDDARRALVEHLLAGKHAHIVVCEDLLTDPILTIAAEHGVTVWVVPAPLLHALCVAAGIRPRAQRPVARLLARLPLATPLRPLLRQIRPRAADPRQTSLL